MVCLYVVSSSLLVQYEIFAAFLQALIPISPHGAGFGGLMSRLKPSEGEGLSDTWMCSLGPLSLRAALGAQLCLCQLQIFQP